MKILGISAYYHDSAAALVEDGAIVGAVQEERFSRRKHDDRFPKAAISWCMAASKTTLRDLDSIVFYDKPMLKFDRLLETYLSFAPHGFRSFAAAMPTWLKDKLNLKSLLRRELASLAGCRSSELPPLYFTEHHQAHAASAFFPSPFQRAGILCLDGAGEWATTSVWLGEGNELTPIWQIDFPHSLGLLYSAFTYYAGFKVNSGEYKLMGLAPYGEPRYTSKILKELIDLKPDGTFRLNMKFFNYATGLTMTSDRFHDLFGGAPRKPESPVTQREMDLAASIQKVTEEAMIRLARTVHRELDAEYLCLAGGVALNCVANGRILREGPFRDLWIQPAADDAGGALGAALSVWHEHYGNPKLSREGDAMQGSYLGPSFTGDEIEQKLLQLGAHYRKLDEDQLIAEVAEKLTRENVVGWFQGRMEFGPRALGARSILADPRSPAMQSTINLKIKYRESFRPFAPAIMAERVSDYFDLDRASPYMSLVAPVCKAKRTPTGVDQQQLFGIERLNEVRSTIPAVTHVDYSARIQTVHRETNPLFYGLLAKFEQLTGCPVLVNTSFNVRGEPIVCAPEDAYRCFMRTEMDYLVIGSFILAKTDQLASSVTRTWQKEFQPD